MTNGGSDVDTNTAPTGDNLIELTVTGGRVVNGHRPGETFEFDLGEPGSDARAANERQVRAWIMGGHVVDPVLATRKRKRKRRQTKKEG